LDLSSPQGKSFNDNIAEELLEKVSMATEKVFGYVLTEAGKSAKFSKFDTCDAYKCVPAARDEFRLQGFLWLDRFFFEKKQVFGAKSAVPNYDQFGNTICTLASVMSNTPTNYVTRCLDDVPVVGPANSNICKDFSEMYKSICNDCNIQLAQNCKKNEKAFELQSVGKVLGIWFDSENLAWQYPSEKREKTLDEINKALASESYSLENMQTLMGRLNDFLQMCPFMKCFKSNLNSCLSECYESGSCTLSKQAKDDLFVWASCIIDNVNWFPIPVRPSLPPIQHRVFVSDAAGLPEGKKFTSNEGVGGIGFDEEGCIISAFQVIWQEKFINFIDNKGAKMGAKTTTLEIIGILLHIVSFPEEMVGRQVVFKTDNMACYFGWENRYVKGDMMASMIIRAICLISAYLNCNVYVCHLPRMSNWEAEVADRLSRRSSMTQNDKDLILSFGKLNIPQSLVTWLSDPSEDWQLPIKLLNDVKKSIKLS
jgi:hypothetical protein